MGKIFTVTLPDIGEGVVEGEVIEWLKKVGDTLKQDEPVVIVMTDKATVELPAPHPGKLAKQYFQPGQLAILDKPLYDIELAGDAPEIKDLKREHNKPVENVQAAKQKPKTETASSLMTKPCPKDNNAQTQQATLAIPAVRHLAKELGIPLDQIKGSGKSGRVTAEDLKQHRETSQKTTELLSLEGDQEEPLIGIRNLMARKMAESKANIPHFAFFEQVEVSRLIQLRQNIKKQAGEEGVQVTYMPFIIRALSATIKKFPHLNSSLDIPHNKLIVHHQQNVGIAVSTHFGLIVPVLKNVQDMSLEQIIRSYEEVIEKAKTNKLHSSDMKEGTITISNYGGIGGGGQWATPIINYPEAAILAVARIQKQPWIKNGVLGIGDVLNVSWSFDHRIIDGDMAVHISHHFCSLIQNPATLL